MITILKLILICIFLINNVTLASTAEKILEVVNSLKVEEKWQKGNVINCRTGEILQEETKKYRSSKLKRLTHCSCFVYAVARNLGVPNESLPPHPKNDNDFIPALSNKQAQWYAKEGSKQGWQVIQNTNREAKFIEAQKLANQGYLVVAIYENTNIKRAGHTSIVIPSNKDLELVKKEGPDTTQAGNNNFSCGSLKQGFKNKKNVFQNNEIKFYYYKI